MSLSWMEYRTRKHMHIWIAVWRTMGLLSRRMKWQLLWIRIMKLRIGLGLWKHTLVKLMFVAVLQLTKISCFRYFWVTVGLLIYLHLWFISNMWCGVFLLLVFSCSYTTFPSMLKIIDLDLFRWQWLVMVSMMHLH